MCLVMPTCTQAQTHPCTNILCCSACSTLACLQTVTFKVTVKLTVLGRCRACLICLYALPCTLYAHRLIPPCRHTKCSGAATVLRLSRNKACTVYGCSVVAPAILPSVAAAVHRTVLVMCRPVGCHLKGRSWGPRLLQQQTVSAQHSVLVAKLCGGKPRSFRTRGGMSETNKTNWRRNSIG